MSDSPLPDFGERFQVIRPLGAGGMGAVFEARDLELNTDVAIKLLPTVSPDSLLRFKQEFRSLTELVHPNLISMYELLSDGTNWYFTMELINGTGLRSWLQEDHTTSAARAAPSAIKAVRPTADETVTFLPNNDTSITTLEPIACDLVEKPADQRQFGVNDERLRSALRQLAIGLQVLHDHGRLHRDIKFSNVMVRKDGTLVILDFGLVILESAPQPVGREFSAHVNSESWLSSDNSEGMIAGTVTYMAPEQAAALPLTAACDWYSVGVMLYDALVGHAPFSGSPADILKRKRREDPPPPESIVQDRPLDLCHLCMGLLARNPNARLTGDDILAVVGREGTERGAVAAQHQIPFLGRDGELQTLQAAWSQLEKKRQLVVHVRGHSGVGKSTLIRHFLDAMSESSPAVVLTGKCYEQESVPFKAFDTLIDSLSRYLSRQNSVWLETLLPKHIGTLARIFPVLQQIPFIARQSQQESRRLDPQELRLLAVEALRSLLAILASQQIVVIAIDDLQWGDADSAGFLQSLLDQPVSGRLLFLMSYRDEQGFKNPCLRTIRAEQAGTPGGDPLLNVEPLAATASRELAQRLLLPGSDRDAQADRVVAESRGNPYFVAELAQHINRHPDSVISGISLDTVVWERVADLSVTARNFLEFVCIAGRPLRVGDIARVTGERQTHHQTVTTLRAARLLRGTGVKLSDEIEVYHDRIRETVFSRLSEADRTERFGRLADTLEQFGGSDAETLATFFEGAGQRLKAGDYFEQAAQHARDALAFERAAEFFQKSIDLRPLTDQRRRSLLTDLGQALANAGHGVRASAAFLAAAQGAEANESLDLHRRGATQLSIAGHIDEARHLYRNVLANIGVRLPSEGFVAALVSLVWHRARLALRGLKFRATDADQIPPHTLQRVDTLWAVASGMTTVNTFMGMSLQTQALSAALDAGEPGRIGRSLAWEAFCRGLSSPSKVPASERLLSQAEAAAIQVGDFHAQGMVRLSRGMVQASHFQFTDAIAQFDQAEALFQQHLTGAWWELQTIRWMRTTSRWHLGRLKELRADTLLFSAEARKRGDDFTLSNMLGAMHPYLSLALNRVDEAQSARAEAAQRWGHSGFHYQHLGLQWSQLQIHLYEGRGTAAHELFESGWATVRKSLVLTSQLVRSMYYDFRAVCAVAAASESRQPKPYLRLAERLAKKIRQDNFAVAEAFANRVSGLVAQQRQQSSAAEQFFRRSAAGFHAANMQIHAASVDFALGRMLGGDTGRALEAVATNRLTSEDVASPEQFVRIHTWLSPQPNQP